MMGVIINGQATTIPLDATPLTNQADFFLNFLLAVGEPEEAPPLGDFLARYHNLEGEWLVSEPIYWEASHNDAFILAHGDDLGLSEEEAFVYFQELKNFFAEDGVSLYYHDKNHWLIEKLNKTNINAKPTQKMRHQSLMPALNAMDSSMYWQQLMTELQMFLSNSLLNSKRQDKYPINGLWIYGEGLCHFPEDKVYYTDDERLIRQFPSYFQILKETSQFDENTFLVLNKPESLPKKLPNIPMVWRWNNASYQTKKQQRWTRFWRFLKNADKA